MNIIDVLEIAAGVILAKLMIGLLNESYWYKYVRARKLLKTIFHSYRILEEVKLPGSTASHRKGVLYLDFYIPQIMLAIEVHGQQHYKYTPFFHKNKADFAIAKAKDEDKISWCELNKIDIIVLKYSDSDEQWRDQIENG